MSFLGFILIKKIFASPNLISDLRQSQKFMFTIFDQKEFLNNCFSNWKYQEIMVLLIFKSLNSIYTIWSHLYVESNEQNKLMNTKETEAWIHGTDWQLSEGRGWGTRWKKVKGFSKERTYVAHKYIDSDNNVLLVGGKGVGKRGEGGQAGENWGWTETLTGVMGTWCSVHIMFYWVVHLKTVWFWKSSPQ